MARSTSLAAAPQPTPGLPENADVVEFAGWEGIDTKPPRSGVDPQHCAWCDNMMPIGPNNLRAMPDIDAAAYIAPMGLTILDYDFFGLQPGGVNNGPSIVALLSDGSAQGKLINLPQTTYAIAPAGTFPTAAAHIPAMRQYGTVYLLFTSDADKNDYWIWDGAVLYSAGTIGPEVTLQSPGTGYTSPPTVGIVGGSGSGATFTATIANGGVTLVTPNSAGSGWVASDAPKALLTFTGGGSGSSAYGTAVVQNGCITGAFIINGGSGFTSIPTIVITDATGTGASIIVTGISGGVISQLTVVSPGHGYSNPSIATSGGGGMNFQGAATVQNGVITSVTMTAIGSGYGASPQVIFLAATGSGATGTAVLSGAGTITSVLLGNQPQTFTGAGYPTATGAVTVGFIATSGPAAAVIQLMPFGVSGNTVEVYESIVWISTTFQRVKTFFSAPNTVSDFGPPDGAGVFPVTDSILRYQITRLLESNGFLYLIGDSSVNYISGVQTSGSPPITTFSNLNIDPQIGSPYRDSCTVYSRALVMVNSFGVHAIYGGAVQKISTPLDGVFNSVGVNQWLNAMPQGPQSAIATIFGVHVYALLLPIIDPISGSQRNAIFLWDGKRWWTATPSVSLTLMKTLEWGSDINAYGSDGTTVWPLFAQTTHSTTKTLQSRLGSEPTILQEKKPLQMYALWAATNHVVSLNFTIDTESSSQAVTQGPFASAQQASPLTYWGRSVVPDSLGFCIGFTMTSTSPDFVLVKHEILQQNPRRLKV